MADTVDTSQHVFCTNCNLDLTTSRNGPWNLVSSPENRKIIQGVAVNNKNFCHQCFVSMVY